MMFPPVTIGSQTFTAEVVTDENDTHYLERETRVV